MKIRTLWSLGKIAMTTNNSITKQKRINSIAYGTSLFFSFFVISLFVALVVFILTFAIQGFVHPVKMSSAENTKLCDFTCTNNNGFICTPIAPPASPAAFYEIKPALLNLVMKEQFSPGQ